MMCKIWLRGLDTPSPPAREVMAAMNFFIGLAMKIELFAGHNEAREALLMSVAGVTAMMLIESLILLVWY